MEQVDLKDDTTKSSTQVETDSLAFAKSQLGGRGGVNFRARARIESVFYPHIDSANGPRWGMDGHLS